MTKIIYLGKFFEDDLTPMRGIAQSLFREWAREFNKELDTKIITENYREHVEEINSSDLVMIPIEADFDRDLYSFIQARGITVPIGGIATEAFDFMFRKSAYQFFNYTGTYLYDKLIEYGIYQQIEFTISGSPVPLKQESTHIFYPYIFAPSVFEDKIEFMRNWLSSNPKISIKNRNEGACMVYKYGNQFREEVSELIEDILNNRDIDIKYGGKWKNNDDRVKFDYHYDILKEYFSKFKYNIAVENDYTEGWITEKLINGMIAGCVTIYYYPFKDRIIDQIFNPKAFIAITDFDLYRDPEHTRIISEIERINSEDFDNIPAINPKALEIFNFFVYNQIQRIHQMMVALEFKKRLYT